MSDEEGGSSGSSTPEPPEPMDAEEEVVPVEGKALEEAVREAVAPQEEDELDLKGMAREFAGYLVVDSKQDKQVLDDRIESVVFRVEEFKSQLEHMHQHMTSNTGKLDELHRHIPKLKELFTRIDQVEAFVQLTAQNVDVLEEAVSRAERELDPSTIRKVFTAFPKLGKTKKGRNEPPTTWQRPQAFRAKDYFSSPTS